MLGSHRQELRLFNRGGSDSLLGTLDAIRLGHQSERDAVPEDSSSNGTALLSAQLCPHPVALHPHSNSPPPSKSTLAGSPAGYLRFQFSLKA